MLGHRRLELGKGWQGVVAQAMLTKKVNVVEEPSVEVVKSL